MKKVLFLLFAVLCLVSCQTATVEDSPELETLVPVVEGVSDSNSIVDVGVVGSEETSLVPVVEPQLDVENEITVDLEAASENPSKEEGVDVPAPEEPSNEDSNVEVPLESSPVVQDDSVLSYDMDSSIEDSVESFDVAEEPSVETSFGLVEEAPLVGESSTDSEKPIDEPLDEPAIEETNTESLPSQPNAPVEPIVRPKANAEPKVEEGSFLDRLTAFVLREKLFSFGVLTVFIGIVMLIVVMIRDLVRAGRSSKGHGTVQDSADDEPSSTGSKAMAEASEKQEERKESSSIDDDDEFLRSLLNS